VVAASLSLLTLTGGSERGAQSGYSLAGMIVFEASLAAGLGFGISDVAIKALSGDLDSGPAGLLSSWSVGNRHGGGLLVLRLRSQPPVGDGVAVIAVTSVAANLSTILAGLAVFGDRLGDTALVIGVRVAAFALILVGAALIPAPVRADEALEESAVEPEPPAASPALRRTSKAERSPQTAARQP